MRAFVYMPRNAGTREVNVSLCIFPPPISVCASLFTSASVNSTPFHIHPRHFILLVLFHLLILFPFPPCLCFPLTNLVNLHNFRFLGRAATINFSYILLKKTAIVFHHVLLEISSFSFLISFSQKELWYKTNFNYLLI